MYTGFGIELRFDSAVRREVMEEDVVVEIEGRLDEADSLSTTSTTAHVPVLRPSLEEVECPLDRRRSLSIPLDRRLELVPPIPVVLVSEEVG